MKITTHQKSLQKQLSPDKVPLLPDVDRQEYDTQEPRCGRGIGSEENKLGCLICTFCQIFRQVRWKPRSGIEIGSGNLYLLSTIHPFGWNIDNFGSFCQNQNDESNTSRSRSSTLWVNLNLLHKKYLTANIQCWISSIYFNEISLSCIYPKVITLCVLE